MESYKISIEIAILVFPVIAFILTIPFLIHQYQKYGAIPFFKSVIFYSLILYLITAYFMVILPLPSKSLVSKLTTAYLQLKPFNFLNDIRLTTSFKVTTIKELLRFLNKPTVYTILFNFLLTMPFGFYLRYFFKKKWYQTIILTFLLSLFFELTQLSGLYGYYPRPYRIFDVDDLIINTTGGLLGHIFAPLLMFFLPSRDELEEKSYLKGQKVTLTRRFLSFFIDIIFVILLDVVIKIIFYNSFFENYTFLFSLPFYFIIIPLITKGQTIGKKIVKIKISGITKELTWYKLLFRNMLLLFFILFPFLWLNLLERHLHFQNKSHLFLIIRVIFLIIQLINILYYLKSIIHKENIFLYEKITNTKNVSTITVEKDSFSSEKLEESVEKSSSKEEKSTTSVDKKNNDIKSKKIASKKK